MANQPIELQRINWSESFSFTHLFKTFRLAIHPGKLGLAVVGLFLLGLWGGVLDAIWPADRPLNNEMEAYWQVSDMESWERQAENFREDQLYLIFQAIQADGYEPEENLQEKIVEDTDLWVDQAFEQLEKQYDKALEAVDSKEAELDLGKRYTGLYLDLQELKKRGIFRRFIAYEHTAIMQMIDAARALNFTGYLDDVVRARGRSVDGMSGFAASLGGGGNVISLRTGADGIGVLPSIILMFRGVQYLVFEHFLFSVFLLVGALLIWAYFGAAIGRMAALNVARDERISIKEATDFAQRKYLDFIGAPILPIGLIIFIGFCLFIGGAIISIPFIGELIGAVTFPLAILGGFVIALVLLGAIAGGSLMWPTISVEGSDAFDAMSRSYSYVFSRPWRAALYALVLILYGAITYLFLRFFVLLLLKCTRWFLSAGAGATEHTGTGQEGATKIHAIWSNPTMDDLMPTVIPFGLGGAEVLAAYIIKLWVFILLLALCGYLVNFWLSGSTVAYYLLRKKVDRTDMEDVYLEDEEDDLFEAPGSSEAASSPAASTPSAGQGSTTSTADDSATTTESNDKPDDSDKDKPST